MQTIKKGSKGEDVKTLQRILGLTADGVFGAQTEAKVKAFQTQHGVTSDGIVGSKTWELLMQKRDGITILKKTLSVALSVRCGKPIKYLVIHFTAGRSSLPGSAKACYNTFAQGKASADFAVDDTDIVQFNPDLQKYYCWAVGGSNYHNKGGLLYQKAFNSNCISIEICSTCSSSQGTKYPNHDGWSFTGKALDNAAKLAKFLMRTYNIPITNVIRHYDVNGKLCPGIVGWNNEPVLDVNGKSIGKSNTSSEWEKFKAHLKE